MNVGIIGSGGREHAICASLRKSRKIKEIYCFPGNAGTSFIAKNTEADLTNFEELKKLIQKFNIDLIIIGPEKPLVDGMVDFLKKIKLKFLVQAKLPLNSRVLKYLQKIYVKNIISLQQILECSITLKKVYYF